MNTFMQLLEANYHTAPSKGCTSELLRFLEQESRYDTYDPSFLKMVIKVGLNASKTHSSAVPADALEQLHKIGHVAARSGEERKHRSLHTHSLRDTGELAWQSFLRTENEFLAREAYRDLFESLRSSVRPRGSVRRRDYFFSTTRQMARMVDDASGMGLTYLKECFLEDIHLLQQEISHPHVYQELSRITEGI